MKQREGTKVPNRRLKDLLEALLHHHQTVRRPDEFGVKLYEDTLENYLIDGKLPVGKAGYLLNRLHPKGRWKNYYSKVHIKGEKVKQPHPLVLYFKQRPEEIILSTEGFAFDVKEEVKLHLGGSVDDYDQWVCDLVTQEQVRLMGKLMNKVTVDRPLRDLPVMIKKVLLKSVGHYLMCVGPKLDHEEMILLKSLFVANGVDDTYKVFG